MKNCPAKVINLIVLIFVLFLQFSCSKDSDLFADVIKNDIETAVDEITGEEPQDDGLVSKSFTFSTINDAYIQEDKGYDQSIIRMEENNRTSYLMFDLSPVIGDITNVVLEFTIYNDEGDGTIEIFKGLDNDWTEEDLTQGNAPQVDIELASLNKSYNLGITENVILQASEIQQEKTTLILKHSLGNDFAIASKEHSSKKGPKLKVTYKVPAGTEDITVTVPDEILPDEPQENPVEQEQDNNPLTEDVAYWKELFDLAWVNEYPKAVLKSESRNTKQEYYFLAYALDGLIQVWQATGDNAYLEDALNLIENTIDDAVPMAGSNSGYLGWPSDLEKYDTVRNQEGTSLWEAYLYRHVATLLRIMYKSPSLMASGTYQSRYETILAFTETHIFDKWYNNTSWGDKGHIYRSRTHIVSHWARIGMELYLITGKPAYKEVFDNISYAGISKYSGASIRSRIYNNSSNPTAYSLNQTWETNSVQDTSHGADVVSFLVNAHENGMYWDLNDMNAFVSMLDDVIWTDNSPLQFTKNFDGSGGSNSTDAGFHGMITLGRFNENLQGRIRDHYTISSVSYQESHAMGIAAMNRKILNDGSPVYPEEY